MAQKKPGRKKNAVEALATGAAIALGSSLGATDASAATITVTTTSDTTTPGDGECTLREALINANADADLTGTDCAAGAGPDVVTFESDVTGFLVLEGGTLYIYDSVDIQGPGRDVLAVDGYSSGRVFDIPYSEGTDPVVSISGLTITNGYSYSGSGIRAEDATLSITDARISNNAAYYDGGGIAFYDGPSLTITNTIITGNTSNGGNGGGVAIDGFGISVVMDNMQLTDNNAAYGGGGLDASFDFSGSLTIRNSTITGNNSGTGEGSGGGGASIRSFSGSALSTRRGAEGAGAKARGMRTTTERAGRRKAPAQATTLARQQERSLRAKPAGLSTLQVIIEDTTVANNTAYSDGGGLNIVYSGDLQIRKTTISGNIAGGVGGGASINSSSGLIENSTVAQNTAQYAAALGMAYSSLTIKETTISGNTATGPDSTTSAVEISSASGPVLITNSIIANTNGDQDVVVQPSSIPNVTLSYTLVENPPPDPKPWTEGPGNIYGQDPQLGPLQNNGGTTETMEPALTSPVVDAGDPAFVPPPATDQRDAARVSGAAIDMGSVEVQIVVLVPGSFQFASPTYSVDEGGNVTITVNREGGTDGAVSVNVAVTAGTATNGTDYTFAGTTLNWADGETGPKTFIIPALTDAVVDPAETVTLSLQAPTGGTTVGVQSTTVLTINDVVVLVPGSFQFASPTYSVNEGGDVTITVNREVGTDGPVSVNVAVTAGTATNGTDYTFAGTTLTWADGETGPKTFVIPALADLVADPAETVTLSLQAPTGGATIGVQSTTVLTINDVAVSAEVPTLGFLMKLLLVLGVGATGVVVMGRGRLLVYLLAALLALSAAPGVNAAQREKKPRTMKRAKPNVDVAATTVEQISRRGRLVTLKAGGQTLTLRASRIEVRDRRGNDKRRARLGSLQAGTAVMMRVRRGKDGEVQRVRLVMFDSLDMAKQAVAKRPAVR